VKQSAQFDAFTQQVLQADTEIIASAVKIKELNNEYAQLKAKQDATDNSIQEISKQQNSLLLLLQNIQDSLSTKAAAGNLEAPKSHGKAHRLLQNMDDLESQVDNLTAEIQKVHVNSYSTSIAQVAQILNSQATCLDNMQAQTEAVADRIRNVEKVFK